MTVTTPLLEVTDLAVSYGRVEAVRGVTFTVAAGAAVTLIGANGAGKTSTLLAISGVLPKRGGRVHFRGEDVTGLPPHQLVQRGIVQAPEGRQVLAQMSVEENLLMGAYLRRGRAVQRDVQAMYERFPVLGERRRLAAGSLSGGEQQMLALARALMARPQLLLLDEPSMGLAPLLVDQIFQILADIHTGGASLLLVEQNARKALALASHAYVMELGRITLSGPAATLAQDASVTAAYLGTSLATPEPCRLP